MGIFTNAACKLTPSLEPFQIVIFSMIAYKLTPSLESIQTVIFSMQLLN
jgi:hypothetical protein